MIRVIVFLFLGSILLMPTVAAWKSYTAEPIELASLDFTEDLSGTYVKGTIDFVYGYYYGETHNDSVVVREYLIDTGNGYFMGLHVPKKDYDKIDQLMHASSDFAQGNSTIDTVWTHKYDFEGVISPIPPYTLDFYRNYRDLSNFSAQDKQRFLPFFLDTTIKNKQLTALAVCGTAAGIGYLAALAIFIFMLRGWNIRYIRKYIETSPDPLTAQEKVENFLQNTQPFHGVYCNGEFICWICGCTAMFVEARRIIWAHQYAINPKYAGIHIKKKEEFLVLHFQDFHFEELRINLKKSLHVSQFINRLSECCPWITEGYSDELLNMYNKDRNAFLNLRYNPWHEEQAKKDPFYNSDTTNSTNVY